MVVDVKEHRILEGNVEQVAREDQTDEVSDRQGDVKETEFLGLGVRGESCNCWRGEDSSSGEPNRRVVNHRKIRTGTGMVSTVCTGLDLTGVRDCRVSCRPTTTFFAPIERTFLHLFRCRRTRWGRSVSPRLALLGIVPAAVSSLGVGVATVGGLGGRSFVERGGFGVVGAIGGCLG